MSDLDGVYIEVVLRVVVDDADEVVSDVLPLLVAGGVPVGAGHGGGHVEQHLHDVVAPHVRVPAVLAVLLEVQEQVGLLGALQRHQRAQLTQELHVPDAHT